jgi:hypothetical protein
VRDGYFMRLRNLMIKMGTNDATIRVITDNLRSWLYNSKTKQMQEIAPDASPNLIEAIEDQTKIGWDQGRISRKWGALYNYDIETGNVKIQRPSALRWGKEIILETLNLVIDLWLLRNRTEHDMDIDPIERRNEKIRERIREEQEKIGLRSSIWANVSEKELKKLKGENLLMILEKLKMVTKKCD